MKKNHWVMSLAAFAALAASSVTAAVITIGEGETLYMGGSGTDPLNDRDNYIVFEPGSTLVMTQNFNSGNISVWATLIATNGAATVKIDESAKTRNLTLQMHVFAYGNGSLTLENISTPYIGHPDFIRGYRLDNLFLGEGVDSAVFHYPVALLGLPQSGWMFSQTDSTTDVYLYGTNMFNGGDVKFPARKLVVCNTNAIPAGTQISVPSGKQLVFSPLSIPDPENGIVGVYGDSAVRESVVEGCNYGWDVSLGSGVTLEVVSAAAVTVSGDVSGDSSTGLLFSGRKGTNDVVTLSGDNSSFFGTVSSSLQEQEVILAGLNAATNAVIDMSNISVLSGAADVPSLSINSLVCGTDCRKSALVAAAGQTISVGSLSGAISIRGGGTGSAVSIGIPQPGVLVRDDKTAVITYGGESLPDGAVTADMPGSDTDYVIVPGENGFEPANISLSQIPALDVPDGALIISGTNNVTVRAAEGTEAVIKPAEGEVFSVTGEGVFKVESFIERADVSWWFDFSRADTRLLPGAGQTDEYLNSNFNGQQLIEGVFDWRQPDADRSLWNRRGRKGKFDFLDYVYPFIPSTTQNSLEYLSLNGSSRRLPFSNGEGYNTYTSCTPKLVVMVFGAQHGGGYAMIGTQEGAFGRTGTKITHPMTTNTNHDVWVDGVKVNPAETCFKAGWQIISIDTDGLSFTGLGMLKDVKGNLGGQNYGEVMIFTNAVSDRLRLEAEVYLARKWGLESQYSETALADLIRLRADVPVRISGAGNSSTVINAGEQAVSLEGAFSGTVNLAGGTLVVQNRPLPYTPADIPSENRLYWADPDDAETVFTCGEIDHPSVEPWYDAEVRAIADKSLRSFTAGSPILYAIGTRRPIPASQSRGLGPVRTWLDYNLDSDSNGNCLRFLKFPSSEEDLDNMWKGSGYDTMASMPVRTAFVVQDSVRGGGNPLIHDVSGGTMARLLGDWAEPIWPGKPAALLTGENRLNSLTVDPDDGFLGQPEVFTLRASDNVNLPFIGNYRNTQGSNNKGEIIGEILLYSSELEDTDIKGIEAYLMGKWIGRLPQGYADIRNAVVAGEGTVKVAVGAQMPIVGPDFEGTVSVEDGVFRMTIDPDTGIVSASVNSPDSELELPAECSITVDFTEKPPRPHEAVTYVLVNCASGAENVEWTLVEGANKPSNGRFSVNGNVITYQNLPSGLVLSVR